MLIGLPVYNGQRFLGTAIDSLLSQSFTDFRLVISDNGSTDATPELCASYSKQDGRITYLRSPENRGILWNHRRVMDEIDGSTEYFRWAGADDILEPGLLQEMVTLLDARREVEAVVPDVKNIDDEGKMIGSMPRTLHLPSTDVVERARQFLTAGYQHVFAYGLLRVATLRRMRTRPAYLGWDPIFALELILRGQMLQTTGSALLRRFHPGSISRVKTAKEMRKWVEPNTKNIMSFPHWTWAYERARVLMSSPVSTRDRCRIAVLLLRTMLWQKGSLVRDLTQAARRKLGLSDEYTF
jgi:glycosyltransferase involved in cell wall biosynthesis